MFGASASDHDIPESDRAGHGSRWTPQRAAAWRNEIGWICGFNFLPSSAVNFIEMWHPDSFDANKIALELNWAAEIGLNALRTNLQFVLWEEDRSGYIDRIDRFLDIAGARGIRTVFCLFDDCGFSGARPDTGPQGDPVAGVHNSRAMASPGRETVMNPSMHPALESYVRDIVSAFRNDERILFWDVYNEPGNLMIFRPDGQREFNDALESHSLDLMRAAFVWARSCAPEQPLTSGAWHVPQPWNHHVRELYEHAIDRTAFELSDIISFHAYCDAAQMAAIIDKLARLDRPLMCTEWMARNIGSRISDQLKLFHETGVGAFQWGLVRGRTQTHVPWPGVIDFLGEYEEERSPWFHDLLHENGRPYCQEEVDIIRSLALGSN